MGYLTVFSETGTPHSGCLIEYVGGVFEWLSFMPRITSILDVFPGGNFGWIDTVNRENAIASYARFRIEDNQLSKGRNTTVSDYQSASYGLFINDCVSFSRDMSRNCGLITQEIAYIPADLVLFLKCRNKSVLTHTNTKPFPWRVIHKKK